MPNSETSAQLVIRAAAERDLDELLAIYNDAILHSTALWVDEAVDRSDREAWLAAQQSTGHPVFVAEVDGHFAGYSSYSQWREKYGFRFSVEDSVYILDGYRGRGVGRALLEALIAHAKEAGLHAMIADIESANAASIALHERLGFVTEGNIRELGTKFGRWLDLIIMRLPL